MYTRETKSKSQQFNRDIPRRFQSKNNLRREQQSYTPNERWSQERETNQDESWNLEDEYQPQATFLQQHKKKLIIGLIAVAGIAAAAGIIQLIMNAGKVEVLSVQPATLMAQQPYQNCQQVATTNYSRNHKNGTEGAVIGGVGGAVVGGLISHSLVGVGVGAVVGGVGGDLIQRSHQADYVAHHGSTTHCETAYRQIQVPVGYQIGYLNDGVLTQITTQHQVPIGSKVKLTDLEADQVSTLQQQQLVQQAIAGNQTPAPSNNQ